MKGSLTTLFLISILLVSSIQAFKVTTIRGALRDGAEVALRSMGDSNQRKYLDADTATGAAYLSPSTQGSYTGTRFRVIDNHDGTYSFQCLGGEQKPEFRYLNGRTEEGKIDLSPTTEYPYTGARWKIKKLSDGHFALLTQGHTHVASHRYLDSNIGANQVFLGPNTLGNFGAHWKIINVAGGNGGTPTHLPVRLPVQVRPAPCHTSTLGTLLRDGEVVAFRNMACTGEHKYLDADTATGATYLSPSIQGSYTGTRFRVIANNDGTYSFQCLGGEQKPQYRYLDGRTEEGNVDLVPTTDAPYTGARWTVRKLPDGYFYLETMGANRIANHRFLDANFGANQVLLSGHAKSSPSAHWKIIKTTAP